MRLLLPLACLATLAACSSDEPERPSERDEERFEEIDAMLDEERDEREASP